MTLDDSFLESPWSTFYSCLLHFFAIYYDSRVTRQNVYNPAVFTGWSTSLHSNFTWTG